MAVVSACIGWGRSKHNLMVQQHQGKVEMDCTRNMGTWGTFVNVIYDMLRNVKHDCFHTGLWIVCGMRLFCHTQGDSIKGSSRSCSNLTCCALSIAASPYFCGLNLASRYSYYLLIIKMWDDQMIVTVKIITTKTSHTHFLCTVSSQFSEMSAGSATQSRLTDLWVTTSYVIMTVTHHINSSL